MGSHPPPPLSPLAGERALKKAGTRISGHTAEALVERATRTSGGGRAAETLALAAGHAGAHVGGSRAGGVIEAAAAVARNSSARVGAAAAGVWERGVDGVLGSRMGQRLLTPTVLARIGR